MPIRWKSQIVRWLPPRTFTDVQLEGPYPSWEHTHRMSPVRDGTEIHDHVRYRVPGGRPVERLVVARWLDQIFDYRAERLRELLA